MPAVKNLVPYECAMIAVDLASGKPITNIEYRQNIAPTAVLAYGADIPGSDVATFLGQVDGAWATLVTELLHENYAMSSIVGKSIVGKTFQTPIRPIATLVPGTPVVVTTGTSHGLSTGQQVVLTGITAPAPLNAVWTVTRMDATTLSLNGSSTATAWSGDGSWQAALGPIAFLYGDATTVVSTTTGGKTGEALPLFASLSVRRLNSGVGRKFRSRISMSPIDEADAENGKVKPTSLTTFNTALETYRTTAVQNGSADATAKFMPPRIVSRSAAASLVSPFTSATLWCLGTNAYVARPNFGSIVRRKPKLTAPIT